MGLSGWHPRDELFALVEDRLGPADQTRVETHLAGCAACRTELAELAETTDRLRALPGALRSLTERQSGGWPAVWQRVQGVPVRRMAPQLNLCLSLAVAVFVLAAALPARFGAQPVAVTVGAIQTPLVALATPSASKGVVVTAAQVSTALAASTQATGARALPAQTPMPGLKG